MAEWNIRQQIRTSLPSWARKALDDTGVEAAAHHRLLLGELEALSRGQTRRLMVLMPPGAAKSTYVSILFPAWWFTQHPNSSIIATSHTATLAEYFGRRAQSLITSQRRRLGFDLRSGDRSSSRWAISTGGEYYAVGVRGAITGRRADLAIIDDPVRSRADADGFQSREHLWDWYRSDLTTRLKPHAKVILVMTRWHEDDLGGRLLAQSPTEWRSLRLAALAEEQDPLGRFPGSPIWPEWEDIRALTQRRFVIGEQAWAALFQQSPRQLEGSFFKVTHVEIIDDEELTEKGTMVRAWDLAATADTAGNDPDWTVGVKLARSGSGRFTVLDVTRLRGSPHAVEQCITEVARHDGRSVVIGLPEDPGQAGKSQVSYLVGRLAGYHVVASRESGAKAVRATPVASQIEAGNVAIVRGKWNFHLLQELREFPFGRKDDQVDALARAFNMLTNLGGGFRQIHVPHLGR